MLTGTEIKRYNSSDSYFQTKRSFVPLLNEPIFLTETITKTEVSVGPQK